MVGKHRSTRGRWWGTRRTSIGVAALGAAVVIAPELLGGVYPWGVLCIAALSAGALATSVWVNRDRERLRGALWIATAIALAWTIVQALPLPCGLVRWLSHDSALELERVHALLGRSAPSSCTISRDPGATRLEIVKGLALMSAFATAAVLVQRGQRRNVLRTLALSGTLLALVSLGHAATMATKVFGVYTPVETRSQPFLAPLLNLNTLGGALGLCCPAAIAFAITARDMRQRVLWLAAVAAIATTVLMTRSRGAIGALSLELLLFALLGLRARRQSERPRRNTAERLGLASAVVLVIAVSVYGTYDQVVHEFRVGAWDKLRMIAIAGRFAIDNAWVGIGRGAFSSTFAGVHNTVRRFDYPENFIVQWAAEWGAPVCLLLCAALGHSLVGAVRRANSWERSAAVAGIVGLAVQNLVDLGSELLAVAVMAAVALACAVSERTETRERVRSRWRSSLGALAVGCAITAAALGPRLVREYPGELDRRLSAAQSGPPAEFRALLATAMLAHPSEPSFPLLGAHYALTHHDRAAGRWINRALQRAPGWAGPHTQAAIWLWNSGHQQQALLELAAAARADIYGTHAFACQVAERWPEGLIAAAGRTGDPERFLDLASLCQLNEEQRAAIDRGILRYAPESPHALTRQAARALALGRTAEALALTERVMRVGGALPDTASVHAQALLKVGRPKEALAVLQKAIRLSPHPAELLELQLKVLTELRDRPGIARALASLRGSAANAHELAQVYHREAAVETALGNMAAAVRAYQQAYDVAAEPESLRAVATSARAMGDDYRARLAYNQLCAISPSDLDSCTNAKLGSGH